jgi:hypothetical protein
MSDLLESLLLSILVCAVLYALFQHNNNNQNKNYNGNNTNLPNYPNNNNNSTLESITALQQAVKLLLEQQNKPFLPARPTNNTSGAVNYQLAPSHSPSEVPVEVYQEVRLLQDAVKGLERKNRELNRQITLNDLSNVVDLEHKYNLTTPGHAQTKLTASEIETIRAIFNLFDTAGSGTISTNEIKALHAKLGEPLTDEEAAAAISELDQDGSGKF